MVARIVRHVAQVLNGGKDRGRTEHLAYLMGTPLLTVQSWAAEGYEERQRLPHAARTLLFMLLALHNDGVDLKELRRRTVALEVQHLGVDLDQE